MRYVISAAEQARQQERARQEQARRRWRQLQEQRAELAAWAATVAKQYGQRAVAVPALGDLRSLDEQAVAQQAGQATAKTARLRAQVDQQLAAGRDQWARELVRRIDADRSAPAGPERVSAPAPAPPPRDQVDEVSALVGQLDPEVDPQRVRELVAGIGEATASRRPVLVARLRQEVRTLNRRARRWRRTAAVLAEVAPIAEATGDRILQVMVDQARAAAAIGDEVEPDRLRAEARAAEQRQAARRAQEHVQESLVTALASMGYEVVAEDDLLAPPRSGVLVRRRGGGSRHAIHLVAADGRIRFRAARLVDPDRSTAEATEQERIADRAAEQAWCEDFPRALETAASRHLQLGPLHVDSDVGAAPPMRVPTHHLPKVTAETALEWTEAGETELEEHWEETVRRPQRQQRELGRPG